MITKEMVETVKNRVSIVDIVNLYVELKKKRTKLYGLLPFP